MHRHWMICYDIADHRARRRVERRLLDHAERMQESVFEGHIRYPDLTPLLDELAQHINPTTDSLRAYPLCAWCESRITWQGQGRRADDPDLWII